MDPYLTILSERNCALRDLNMAIAEKRQAIADRDQAIVLRDAAFADRDRAMMQRDNAIAQLELKKTNSMNMSSVIHNPSESGVSVSEEEKQMQMQQQQLQRRRHIINYSEVAFKPLEVPFSDVFEQHQTASKTTKSKKGKYARETKKVSSNKVLKPARVTKTVSSNKGLKPARDTKTVPSKRVSKPTVETETVSSNKALKPTRKISKKGNRSSTKETTMAPHDSSDSGKSSNNCNLEKQIVFKGGVSLNELGLDDANLPVPFCSCTGNPHSCYKWGKCGWQSACCTTTLSMHPLPQMANKRHSRMGGRKMSGGAFTKLIARLASEGHDITVPIDLRNHWAKHGTNRYIIIR